VTNKVKFCEIKQRWIIVAFAFFTISLMYTDGDKKSVFVVTHRSRKEKKRKRKWVLYKKLWRNDSFANI